MRIDHKESYKDFGKQFIKDSKIDDYWGSIDMLKDIVKPFSLTNVKNKTIMEVGIGSGRILKNLIKFNPEKVFAVEPSEAINIAKKNNLGSKSMIKFLNIKAENLNMKNKIDYVFDAAARVGGIHDNDNYSAEFIYENTLVQTNLIHYSNSKTL